MKKKHYLMLLLPMLLGLASCSSKDDIEENPAAILDSKIVGTWYADVSGSTYAVWNYGKAWQKTELKSDGTGETSIYYLFGPIAAACESYQFKYTTTNGTLTMDVDGRNDKISTKYAISDDELKLTDYGAEISMKKMDSEKAAEFEEWSQEDDLLPVPQPARYTVFVYGNAEGDMDDIIEDGFWKALQPSLTDHNNVRVICMYKYGKDTDSSLDEDGDIVWFELTDTTDLSKIRESGLQVLGLGEEAKAMKLCDPSTIRQFIEYSSLMCPAEEYVFAIWGHGSGLVPMTDVPGKEAEFAKVRSRGVLVDEWNNDEELDMYELSEALRSTGIEQLNTIFFHNCLMGNMETLTELRDVADYLVASSHELNSDGTILAEYVRGLQDKGNSEDAIAQMFSRVRPEWDESCIGEEEDDDGKTVTYYMNGDLKLIRANKLDAVIAGAKRLAERTIALYPTQQKAIDSATRKVYRFEPPISDDMNFFYPFVDLADYAHKLAAETGDEELASISQEIDEAFNEALIHCADINNNSEYLDHYTLSVCLADHEVYAYDYMKDFVSDLYHFRCNFNDGYEQTSFHKMTGWGRWLNINQQVLWGNPCGKGETPLHK